MNTVNAKQSDHQCVVYLPPMEKFQEFCIQLNHLMDKKMAEKASVVSLELPEPLYETEIETTETQVDRSEIQEPHQCVLLLPPIEEFREFCAQLNQDLDQVQR